MMNAVRTLKYILKRDGERDRERQTETAEEEEEQETIIYHGFLRLVMVL